MQNFKFSGVTVLAEQLFNMIKRKDDTTVTIALETINLNQLKTLKIAVNNDSVYLTIDEGGILDQSGESLLYI